MGMKQMRRLGIRHLHQRLTVGGDRQESPAGQHLDGIALRLGAVLGMGRIEVGRPEMQHRLDQQAQWRHRNQFRQRHQPSNI